MERIVDFLVAHGADIVAGPSMCSIFRTRLLVRPLAQLRNFSRVIHISIAQMLTKELNKWLF